MSEPITIFSIILTAILVAERCFKYAMSHIKKSKCCGSEVEFNNEFSPK
jgi:hypothetical protein